MLTSFARTIRAFCVTILNLVMKECNNNTQFLYFYYITYSILHFIKIYLRKNWILDKENAIFSF